MDIQKDRYKMFGEYKVDRWIINAAMLLVFGYLFFVAQHYNYNLDYYKCIAPDHTAISYLNESERVILTGPTPCKNPFYKPITWKNYEYLPAGEYGLKPGLLYNSVWYVIIGLFSIAFIVNHFVHNKHLKFIENENKE